MIQIEEKYQKIIKDILSKYPYSFYAFGSRAKGKAKKFSDLDICFFSNIPWNVKSHIDEDFEESDIPYTVDLIDLSLCDESFRNLIQKDLIPLQEL